MDNSMGLVTLLYCESIMVEKYVHTRLCTFEDNLEDNKFQLVVSVFLKAHLHVNLFLYTYD
ncbi:hypothetical protein HA402_015734 [Bradysia odoriphaga]|nr:hypothetical protein HA402_015734 [Bradysia odoriphaga]